MVCTVRLLAASMLVASPVFAQFEQVRRGPAPAWITPSELLPVPTAVTGPVFFRRQDVAVHLSDKRQAKYQVKHLICSLTVSSIASDPSVTYGRLRSIELSAPELSYN